MTQADSVHSTPPTNTSADSPVERPADSAGALYRRTDISPEHFFQALGRVRRAAQDEIERLIDWLDSTIGAERRTGAVQTGIAGADHADRNRAGFAEVGNRKGDQLSTHRRRHSLHCSPRYQRGLAALRRPERTAENGPQSAKLRTMKRRRRSMRKRNRQRLGAHARRLRRQLIHNPGGAGVLFRRRRGSGSESSER
ncbi:hypothetical protein V1289_009383 [Bradyrhizobium sp. AZCC 2289]